MGSDQVSSRTALLAGATGLVGRSLLPLLEKSEVYSLVHVLIRRAVSGIVFVIRNGLRWREAPPAYGPHNTLYNRFIRWSRMGVFGRILMELAKQGGETDEIMIDATHLKAHRTAASLIKKGVFRDFLDAQKVV